MLVQNFWSKSRFPIVYEHECEKAVLVDIDSFKKIETILDNLLNQDIEEEDRMLATSGLLEKLLDEVRTPSPAPHWRSQLDVL